MSRRSGGSGDERAGDEARGSRGGPGTGSGGAGAGGTGSGGAGSGGTGAGGTGAGGTGAQGGAAGRRSRPARGAMESLLRIVHGLEVAGLAFGALAAWGVSRDWPQPTAFLAVAVLLLAAMPLQARAWGWLVSLALQVALAALALVEPVWGVVALVFIILWIYCFVKARGIERQRRAAGLDPRGAPGQ